MDRRGFLKSGGAAAMAAGAASAAAQANPVESGVEAGRHGRWPGARAASPMAVAPGYDLAGFGADRLASRIAVATDRRFRSTRGAGGRRRYEFRRRPLAVALHPGFAFFAGCLSGEGLPAADLQAWLTIGGGQLLWDELARPFGVKPLVAGHSSDSLGLWSNVRLEDSHRCRAVCRCQQPGLVRASCRRWGRPRSTTAPQDLASALTTGRIRAAEWPGPAAAFALQPLAQRLYRPGLHPGGVVITLTVDPRALGRINPADQAIFEACAAEEHRLALAEAKVQAVMATQMRVAAKWPLRQTFAGPLSRALEAAACAVVAEAAGHDAASRRIAASYRAHRLWLSGGYQLGACLRPGRAGSSSTYAGQVHCCNATSTPTFVVPAALNPACGNTGLPRRNPTAESTQTPGGSHGVGRQKRS